MNYGAVMRLRSCVSIALSALAIGLAVSASAQAQDLDIFASKPAKASAPLSFKTATLKNGALRQALSPDNQAMMRFDNSDPHAVYLISVSTDQPGPIALRVLQLDLDGSKRATQQTVLTGGNVNTGEATTLALDPMLLPEGPIYIGLGVGKAMNATVTIESEAGKLAKRAARTPRLKTGGDWLQASSKNEQCFAAPSGRKPHDIRIIARPGVELFVKANGETRLYRGKGAVEKYYDANGYLFLRGMDGGRFEQLCISSARTHSPVRVQITRGRGQAEEPDRGLAVTKLSAFKPDETLTRTTFPGDMDILRLPRAPRGKAHWVDISGVYSADVCVEKSSGLNPDSECVGAVRRIGPLLGGDETVLRLSGMAGGDGTYTVRSELRPYNSEIDRSEPNAEELITQAPPTRRSKTGLVRLRGSHLSDSDTDIYHWADIKTEQLWRVRAVGPGLTRGTIRLNDDVVMDMRSDKNVPGRLSADDVFLTPGKATIELSGTPGEYSILFKPVGPPPPGFELEQGVTGEGQSIQLGQTVTGVLRSRDKDTLVISLRKAADVSLTIKPPLGAKTNVYIPNTSVNEDVEPGDAPIAFTLNPGKTNIWLTPKPGSPLEYEFNLSRRNVFMVEGGPLSLTTPVPAPIRAWSDAVQTLTLPVKIKNKAARAVSGRLTAKTPDHLMLVTDVPIDIPARGSKTVQLPLRLLPDIAPDDYLIMVGVRDAAGKPTGGITVNMKADIDAPDTDAQSQPAVPERLMGAIDLAHHTHGAEWIDVEAGQRSFITKKDLDNLLDDLWVTAEGYQADFRFDRENTAGRVTLKLGADKPVPLVGVGFALVGLYAWPMDLVEIETSTDGRVFKPWIKGVNDHYDALQYMEGETRDATHVRLVLPQSATDRDWSRLSEFYVFAEPGKSGLPRQDLLRHGFGAKTHLNDRSPREQSLMKGRRQSMLNGKKRDGEAVYRFIGDPISFRNVMRADVVSAGIGWDRPERISERKPSRVTIMGTDALAGPWRELVSADVPDPVKSPQFRLDFPETESVRFIRFDYESDKPRMNQPTEIYAFEREESDEYLSVIGSWGANKTRSLGDDDAVRDGGKMALEADPVRGSVQFQTDSDSWTISPVGDANVLVLDVEGGPGFDPKIVLTQSGKTVPVLSADAQPGTMLIRYSYRIAPGETVTVEASEDARSVFVLAAPGGELEAFRSNILNGLVQMSDGMVSGRDAVAFSPMSVDTRTPWITDPTKVTRPVIDMFTKAKSGSDDSKALAATARHMAGRTGSKAIIMIGDGDSSDGDPELETALEAARSRLFIAKPPGGVVDMTHAPTNDVLTGWTQIAGGDVSFDTSQQGYARMFSRASARMRGPKTYRIAATIETRVFEPGQLTVEAAPELPKADRPERTQLVLLDTSGSMLKRIGDTRRFAIARAALTDYVSAQANGDDTFDRIGLRLFGGPPDSCETDLALPPVRLDGQFTAAVEKVVPKNNAKTPIAAALKAAGDDLAKVDGDVNILLLTDGEETCDGDPLAEVEALQARGIDVRLDVVSFALADDVSRVDFEAWARVGGGRYVDAQDSTELTKALAETRSRGFQVYKDNQTIAAGQVGADPISLPAGKFELEFEGSDMRFPISIKSNQTTIYNP